MTRPEPPVPWRRHEQVVRQLPDPAAAPLASVIERYIESGEAPGEAARVLGVDASHAGLDSISSRRKRASKVDQILDQGA